MLRGLCASLARGESKTREIRCPAPAARWACHTPRRLFMVWQTPAATDIRFGFEITLYVAAR
jgi:coenzyme PQQ precursor peptide PqqA